MFITLVKTIQQNSENTRRDTREQFPNTIGYLPILQGTSITRRDFSIVRRVSTTRGKFSNVIGVKISQIGE